MPNWCSNDLYIDGPKRDVVLDAIQGVETFDNKQETLLFDFNKVVPMPSILSGTISPPRDGDAQAAQALAETGFTDWYGWCCKKWGTKWNACNTRVLMRKSRVKVSFETAWSPPIPVILALSSKFPKNTFTLKYYERGMAYKGEYKVKNGVVLVEIEDKYFGSRGG